MRALAVLASLGCSTVDLAARPVFPADPLCLFVNATPSSWQREHVSIAAQDWNDRLDANLVHVAPECSIDDEWVAFSFVHELPGDCRSYYACTYLRARVNGDPGLREVVIQEMAPFETVGHEIGHLLGCRHSDLDPPCRALLSRAPLPPSTEFIREAD